MSVAELLGGYWMYLTALVSDKIPLAFELGRSPPTVLAHAVAAEGSSHVTFHGLLPGRSPSTFTKAVVPAAKELWRVVRPESEYAVACATLNVLSSAPLGDP